ncbi:MAG: hypothetical protein M1828_002669 [Chrysothrix sp. TS-e1954]|nr:MAG: hypothetical protein M1828_002669 [Chrysothrix sp. TS-e1954]
MAKSARASVRKTNRSALRRKVFMPSDLRRQERLSAKLADLIAQPKPNPPVNTLPRGANKEGAMDIDSDRRAKRRKPTQSTNDDMEIDEDSAGRKVAVKKTAKKTPSRVQKKRRGKPHAQLVFPQIKQRKERLQKSRRRK